MNAIADSGDNYLLIDRGGEQVRYEWRSENHSPPPKKLVLIDDTCTADHALKLATSGTALLWSGDFQNARLLLQAMSRRLEKRLKRRDPPKGQTTSISEAFEAFREGQKSRAQVLGKLLIPIGGDHKIQLKRAPNIEQASLQVYGSNVSAFIVSLRELQGVIGAFEWRKKGVNIDLSALGIPAFKLTPHFGVFSPIRGEYLKLVASAKLPTVLGSTENENENTNVNSYAFDIGTGTSVLAVLLAQRGVQRIVATDQSPRAIACALSNVQELGLQSRIEIVQTNLFPVEAHSRLPLKAALIVCNPPWLPAPSSRALDSAVFDPDSQMLKGFLEGLSEHLLPGGEGWLILSDLAEHLGLRSRSQLMQWIEEADLVVLGRMDIRPEHKKAQDPNDPFYKARSSEITSLWRLATRAMN